MGWLRVTHVPDRAAAGYQIVILDGDEVSVQWPEAILGVGRPSETVAGPAPS